MYFDLHISILPISNIYIYFSFSFNVLLEVRDIRFIFVVTFPKKLKLRVRVMLGMFRHVSTRCRTAHFFSLRYFDNRNSDVAAIDIRV